jgi:hypothetical protein
MRAATLLDGCLLLAVCFLGSGCEPAGRKRIDIISANTLQNGQTERSLKLYIQKMHKDCDEETLHWPRDGECLTNTDVVVGCGEDETCLNEFRLERGGLVLDRVEVHRLDGAPYVSYGNFDPSLLQPGQGLELVFEGCGDEVRVPVPEPLDGFPEIGGLSRQGEEILVDWTNPAGADHLLGRSGLDMGGRKSCLGEASQPARLPAFGGDITLEPLEGGEARDETLGVIRVWRGVEVQLESYLPTKTAEGRWSLPGPYDTVHGSLIAGLSIEGIPVQSLSNFSPSFVPEGGAPLLGFHGEWYFSLAPNDGVAVDYTAGPSSDTLVVKLLNDSMTYRGSFPHVAPAVGLNLGVPEPQSLRLSVGPVVLQAENQPADSREVSFSIDWDLGVPVVKPIE